MQPPILDGRRAWGVWPTTPESATDGKSIECYKTAEEVLVRCRSCGEGAETKGSIRGVNAEM